MAKKAREKAMYAAVPRPLGKAALRILTEHPELGRARLSSIVNRLLQNWVEDMTKALYQKDEVEEEREGDGEEGGEAD